jgi:hypothetical protein
MPCYSPPPTAADYYEGFEHNSKLADMLCQIMQSIEARGELEGQELRTRAWWEEHKKRDRERLKREQEQRKTAEEKDAALAKLSPYERKLLGIR